MTIWQPASTNHYLSYSHSCTQLLKELSANQVMINLLSEDWGKLLDHEKEYIPGQLTQQNWVRSTYWTFKAESWLLARVVLPYETIKQDSQLLTQLGNKPIGEIIYQQPQILRQQIEVAPLDQTPYYHYFNSMIAVTNEMLSSQPMVRRSLLYFHCKPILVVEIFLHELDNRLSRTNTAK